MKRIFPAALMMISAFPGFAAEVMPDQLVRETAEKVSSLIKMEGDDPRKLYLLVDFCEDVLPHIDFRAMSRAALGPHWSNADGNQRARFSREFRNHLVRTYSTALRKSSGNNQIIYLPFAGKPEDKTAIVKTEVKQAGGGPNIPIYYNFYKTDSVWKVYDISIEGVSLVSAYRATYADKLQREGLDVLIADIAKRNREPVPDKEPGRETVKSRGKGMNP